MTPLLRMAALVVAALTVSASTFAQSSLTLPSTDDVVPAGGSETLGTLPMGNLLFPAGSPTSIAVFANLLYGFGQFILQSQELDCCGTVRAPAVPGAEGGKNRRVHLAVRGFRACLRLLSRPHSAGLRHGDSMVSHAVSPSLADGLLRFLQIKLSK